METLQTDTTFVMEQYNFDAPIKVKIIYDDDEETNEEIITQHINALGEKRQWGNISYSSIESNSGEQSQVPKINEINSNVHNDSLKVVIENMAAVIGARYKFEKAYETLTTTEMGRIKMKYIDMKYLLFKRSMMVAKSLLLPLKNNERFIKRVVDEILHKAKVNSNMYSIARLLYSDLMAWTEAQIENEKNEVGTPKTLGLNTRESNYTAPYLNSSHRKRKHPSNYTQETNTSTKQSTKQNNYQSSVSNAPSSRRYYPPNTTPYYNLQENYLTETNGLNPTSMQKQNQFSTPPFGAFSTTEYQNTMQTNKSQSFIDNSLHLEKSKDDGQDIFRSSISRDSGFMSPDRLISPQESTNINYQDQSSWQTPSTQCTPISNILNNSVGSCQVCGKLTDLQCLGCFQYFYCSNMCQNLHWSSHSLNCQNNTSATNNRYASNYENIR